MKPSRRAGMTLVELLVTVGVMGVVIAGIAQALNAFQTIYTVQSYKRQASAAGRQGLAVIERDLRAAGFGMEPGLAFDFSVYQGDGVFCGNVGINTNPCAQPNNPTSRDRATGTDNLVFYSREPNYWGGDTAGEPEGWAWQVVSGGGGSLTLKGHLFQQTLQFGQVLQVVCAGAAEQAYVTVGARVVTSGNDDQLFTVTLTADRAGDPYRQTTLATAGGSCFVQNTARVFMINRYRYYVNPALLLPDGTTDSFLMLDTGLDRNNDLAFTAADDIPVARGVVDLQIGYVRPDALGLLGATKEVGASVLAGPLQACAVTIPAAAPASPLSKILAPVSCNNGLGMLDFANSADRYAQYSFYPADSGDPLRKSEFAGNMTAVHVVVVARSEGAVRALAATRAPATMNRTPASIVPDTALKPYAYSVQETMVPVRNTIAASMLSYL